MILHLPSLLWVDNKWDFGNGFEFLEEKNLSTNLNLEVLAVILGGRKRS